MTGGGIDEERIRARIDHRLAALDAVRAHTHGGTAAEAARLEVVPDQRPRSVARGEDELVEQRDREQRGDGDARRSA